MRAMVSIDDRLFGIASHPSGTKQMKGWLDDAAIKNFDCTGGFQRLARHVA